MHMIFSKEEKQWMNMNVFGCPIKENCPDHIKKSIKRKKDIIDKQSTINRRSKQNGKR